jgi:hypothetical protein
MFKDAAKLLSRDEREEPGQRLERWKIALVKQSRSRSRAA